MTSVRFACLVAGSLFCFGLLGAVGASSNAGSVPAVQPTAAETSHASDAGSSTSNLPQPAESPNPAGAPQHAKAPLNTNLLVSLANDIIWQPRNGHFRFTVTAANGSSPGALNSIEPVVSFGWPSKLKEQTKTNWHDTSALRTVARTDTTITYDAELPDDLWNDPHPTFWDIGPDMLNWLKDRPSYQYNGWRFVPTLDMRIVAHTAAVDGTTAASTLDAILPVGISFSLFAFAIAIFGAVFAWGALLWFASKSKRKIPGGVFLRIIANEDNYASLSQFQMLIWTFVIGTGAIYVMALTGSLIDIPGQALALLGISGAAGIGALIARHNTIETENKKEAEAAKAAAPQTSPSAPLLTEPHPESARNNQPTREPKWSDLVVWDGTGEIDITRVQVLAFTVLAAIFVALKIGDENAIPTIPDGIMALMGIVNGVYVSAKFVPSDKEAKFRQQKT
jgi:hypothetical protein